MSRFGFGYDIHKFAPGRKLILGGAEIPFETGLLGHSDADVLLHALSDALLGAAALGDIGKHFPDTDPDYKDISSLIILGRVAAMLAEEKFEIENVDSTIILEKPMISRYADTMRHNIAAALHISVQQVSVKATTNEGMGFIGSGEGVAAFAVASIRPTVDKHSAS